MSASSATTSKLDGSDPNARIVFDISIAYQNSPLPIADVFLIYRNTGAGDTNRRFAYEVLLEWCVQRFSMSVTNGVASIKRLDAVNTFSNDPSFDFSSHQDGMSFEIDTPTHYSLQRYMRTLFKGTVNGVSGGRT
jgi:hypothetical protein